MTARLYCKHCARHYDVPLEDVRIMQAQESEHITFAHNTYYYDDDCFFKNVNRYKREQLEMEKCGNE
ncbi:hypothetical protein [Sulfurimonas sp. HSL3-7]|uniref:hypothetical protein n=1 Tax=Sulfonitrofixus jiaomeiensis TaxID=3131938 RepID=UPI0031FA1538